MANTGDVLVDPPAADAGLDQLLATGYQGKRAEVGSQFAAIESPDGAKCRPEAPQLAGGPAVLDVALLDVLPEGEDQLVDGDWPVGGRVSCGRPRVDRMLARQKPFSDQAVIKLVAFRATVLPEVAITPGNPDDAQILGLVVTILRGMRGSFGHVQLLSWSKSSTGTTFFRT